MLLETLQQSQSVDPLRTVQKIVRYCMSIISVRRYDLLISLAHALMTLLVTPIVYISTADRPFDMSVNDPTSSALTLVLSLSVFYYIVDTINTTIQPNEAIVNVTSASASSSLTSYMSYWFVLHHTICIIALSVPLVYNCDSRMIAIGLSIGEVSNVPRLMSKLIGVVITESNTHYSHSDEHHSSTKRHDRRQRLLLFNDTIMLLSSMHLALFVCTRMLLTMYVLHVVIPYAKSTITTVMCIIMLVCSVVAAVAYIFGDNVLVAATTTTATKMNRSVAETVYTSDRLLLNDKNS